MRKVAEAMRGEIGTIRVEQVVAVSVVGPRGHPSVVNNQLPTSTA
jgi:hypothetical protein